VHPTSLPARPHDHRGDCALEALVGVGDDQLDAAKGGLPQALVAESITRLATEIAPVVRAASASEVA